MELDWPILRKLCKRTKGYWWESYEVKWAQQSVANENVLLPKYISNLPSLAIHNNFLTLLESATCKFPTGAISPKTFYQLWQVEQILSIVKGVRGNCTILDGAKLFVIIFNINLSTFCGWISTYIIFGLLASRRQIFNHGGPESQLGKANEVLIVPYVATGLQTRRSSL